MENHAGQRFFRLSTLLPNNVVFRNLIAFFAVMRYTINGVGRAWTMTFDRAADGLFPT